MQEDGFNLDRELERQQFVASQLRVLSDSRGNGSKLEAAATLLAELGLIPNTPAGKSAWKAQ